MRNLLICAALLVLPACAGDTIVLRPLPAVTGPSTEVTVIRPRSIVLAEFPFYVVVGDQPVFDIRNGEHTRFRVSSGRTSLAIQCLGGPASKPYESRIEHDFPPGGTAHFIIEPRGDCVNIRPAGAAAAAADISTTRFRSIGAVSPIAQGGDTPAVFSAEPAPPPAPPVVVPAGTNDSVAAATAAWIGAFNSRDPARIASLYDSDAVLRDPAGQRIAAGPGAIADHFKSMKAPVTASIGEREIRVFGDTAIDSGTNTLGRYNIVYRNRGGKWLIVDHQSPRAPAP